MVGCGNNNFLICINIIGTIIILKFYLFPRNREDGMRWRMQLKSPDGRDVTKRAIIDVNAIYLSWVELWYINLDYRSIADVTAIRRLEPKRPLWELHVYSVLFEDEGEGGGGLCPVLLQDKGEGPCGIPFLKKTRLHVNNSVTAFNKDVLQYHLL